jgi:hypothetical protein
MVDIRLKQIPLWSDAPFMSIGCVALTSWFAHLDAQNRFPLLRTMR